MDGKRVSLPALGLVLALVFISAQAVYGGQIWEGDLGGGTADTPDGNHISVDPPSGHDSQVCCSPDAPSRPAAQSAAVVIIAAPEARGTEIGCDRVGGRCAHRSRLAAVQGKWAYILWLMLWARI